LQKGAAAAALSMKRPMKNPRKIDEKVLAGRIKHGIIKILRRGRVKEICTRPLPKNKEDESC